MKQKEKNVMIAAVAAIVTVSLAIGILIHSFTSAYFSLRAGLLRNMVFCVLLIIAGFAIMFSLFNYNRRTNEEIREEVRLLRERNDLMQEMAHHQRLEIIGTMTSGIAHEFNNMLTPIMGYSVMAMEKVPEGETELMDDLGEIYDASKRAKSLISRISALSRKNNEAAYSLFSLDSLLEKVEKTAQISVPPHVEIVREYHCPDTCLFADEAQISQLILNLVINAFQAMEENGGVLTISTNIENNDIILRIADTGPGIPEAALPQIFDPFFTTKAATRGTGLGLAISRQIVEEHKGSITAENGSEKGALFTIRLPKANCDQS